VSVEREFWQRSTDAHASEYQRAMRE